MHRRRHQRGSKCKCLLWGNPNLVAAPAGEVANECGADAVEKLVKVEEVVEEDEGRTRNEARRGNVDIAGTAFEPTNRVWPFRRQFNTLPRNLALMVQFMLCGNFYATASDLGETLFFQLSGTQEPAANAPCLATRHHPDNPNDAGAATKYRQM